MEKTSSSSSKKGKSSAERKSSSKNPTSSKDRLRVKNKDTDQANPPASSAVSTSTSASSSVASSSVTKKEAQENERLKRKEKEKLEKRARQEEKKQRAKRAKTERRQRRARKALHKQRSRQEREREKDRERRDQEAEKGGDASSTNEAAPTALRARRPTSSLAVAKKRSAPDLLRHSSTSSGLSSDSGSERDEARSSASERSENDADEQVPGSESHNSSSSSSSGSGSGESDSGSGSGESDSESDDASAVRRRPRNRAHGSLGSRGDRDGDGDVRSSESEDASLSSDGRDVEVALGGRPRSRPNSSSSHPDGAMVEELSDGAAADVVSGESSVLMAAGVSAPRSRLSASPPSRSLRRWSARSRREKSTKEGTPSSSSRRGNGGEQSPGAGNSQTTSTGNVIPRLPTSASAFTLDSLPDDGRPMSHRGPGGGGWQTSARRMWGFSPRFIKRDKKEKVRRPKPMERFLSEHPSSQSGSGERDVLPYQVHEQLTSLLGEMIFRRGFVLVMALAKRQVHTTSEEPFFNAVVHFFHQHNQLGPLLHLAFETEIKEHSATGQSQETLLRSESVATKLLCSCSLLGGGSQFMHAVLSPLIMRIQFLDDTLEVSPSMLKPGADLEENQKRLSSCTFRFIKTIVDSVDQFPLFLREIYAFVRTLVETYFPGMENAVIGNLLFLRWICPAIVCPEKYGLLNALQPSASMRRGLILVSKIMVNVVNGVEFDGTKETYMQPLNKFIVEHQPSIRSFLKLLATTPAEKLPPPKHELTVCHEFEMIKNRLAACIPDMLTIFQNNPVMIMNLAQFASLGLESLELAVPQPAQSSKDNKKKRSSSVEVPSEETPKTVVLMADSPQPRKSRPNGSFRVRSHSLG
eukprot:CAMPEP_0174238672 /NCGR_PEP_ID=MMETSP0417-20130205/12139_1 /TAXON_ID=242541 /ORGANISM="Mayorella sp, Strain BSH-02190019" /LENGTH=866 /DNA_ID=CAMNT_0015317541 /DNA_START=132 /DNA_END=2728 /DNA_ORIENTATION=+